MQGKRQDWAIALGAILLMSLAILFVARLAVDREFFSAIAGYIERWTGDRHAEPTLNAQSPTEKPPKDVFAVIPRPGDPVPASDPHMWITPDDYPAEALRNDWQGAVRIEWTVDTEGRLHDCRVLESSGHAVLDEAACGVILRRARYWPARDADGVPKVSTISRRIIWALPD